MQSCNANNLVNAQIIRFLRPVVEGKAKGSPASAAIYLPLLCVHTEVDERKLREAVKAVGGEPQGFSTIPQRELDF